MESLEEALTYLGLRSGASWKSVNDAYRDLVRVWHPDRFQNDERLRKRAEEQTRLLNRAIGLLREGYDPNKIRTVESRPHSNPRPTVPERPAEELRPEPQTTVARASPGPIGPIVLMHETGSSLVGRALFGVVTGIVGYLSLDHGEPHPLRSAFIALTSLMAVHHLTKAVFPLAIRRPVAAIDATGITLREVGRFAWGDIRRVWTFTNARAPALALECSPLYIERQPLLVRMLLRIRHAFRTAHVVVRFHGTDTHPHALVHAVNTLMEAGLSRPPATLSERVRFGYWWARLIALLAALGLSAYALTTSEPDLGIYGACLAVFALSHSLNTWKKLQQSSVTA
jgi:hypothetical protein